MSTASSQPSLCSEPSLFSFNDLGSRQVIADFSAGYLSSDGGMLLLRQIDEGLGISRSLARLDSGYGNTGSCKSAITFIDGEKGILRYRGYPIEQLAENASFAEVSYLLIYGELPNRQQLTEWRRRLTYHSMIHEDMKKFFEGFPPTAHPMAILSAMVASLSTYYSDDPKSEPDGN